MGRMESGEKNKFPIILQSSSNGCGLACIRMICAYYEKEVTENEILSKVQLKEQGISIADIISFLSSVGIGALAIYLTEKLLSCDFSVPSIICTKLKNQEAYHFLVIYKIEKSSITYVDPGSGLKKTTIEDFNAKMGFSGEAIIF